MLSRKLTGSGFSPLQAVTLLGDLDNGAGNSGIVVTGTAQASAYAIGAVNSVFASVPAGGAAVLPQAAQAGDELTVVNLGANALTVFPPAGGTVNNGAANAGVAVAANGMALFKAVPPSGAAFSGLNYMSK